jgi:hypothetical protein
VLDAVTRDHLRARVGVRRDASARRTTRQNDAAHDEETAPIGTSGVWLLATQDSRKHGTNRTTELSIATGDESLLGLGS